VGKRQAGGLELLQERPGDRDVEAGLRGGEWLDGETAGRGNLWFEGRGRRPDPGEPEFNRVNGERQGLRRGGSGAPPSAVAETVEADEALGRTAVTKSRRGTTGRGASSAEISFASCFEQWKNRGRTTARFSGVMTRASSTMLLMQRLPCRSASSTSG
jgi:hypothetical protein